MKQLWYGGTIYTMEQEQETVEAVLTEHGKIIRTGTVDSLQHLADESIDLQHNVMYPGFVDSHLHMIFLGEKIQRLNLSEATSADEMLEWIQQTAIRTPANQWLFGEGWNDNNFKDTRIPTLEELDSIRQEPILLNRICHHVALVNTAALKAAGIHQDSVNPDGGEIGRDENGKLNGLLYEQAINLVTDTLPKEGETYVNDLTETLELAIDSLLAKGLTGGHTEDMHYFGHFTNPLTAFQRTIGEHEHFRVNLLRHHAVFKEMMESTIPYQSDFIEAGAMKIFLDGALGGSTAALSEPYEDDNTNYGIFIQTWGELEEIVQLARTYNQAIAMHMIGDAAVEMALDVIEKYPTPKGKRDRFIHCSVLREDLINRMTSLPIVVDAQPDFVPSDFPWIEERLGQERVKYAYPWKTLLDNGIMCAASTDAPIEKIDPIQTIYSAVKRKAPEEEHEGYIRKEKLSRFEAIRMYTVGSAQAIGKEHERGLIKPGYDADFSIFNRDLFAGTAEEMLEAKAVKTVVAGKIVFDDLAHHSRI